MFTKEPSTTKYQKSINYKGPSLWNSLPTAYQKIDNYFQFKITFISLFNNKERKKESKSS